jgi:large conductance mechanosensitive channel
MKFIDEFKQFATRGNVLDLAVGIIIGSAFGKIVSSLVADILMPPIGMLIGGVNFTDLKISIQPEIISGGLITRAVTINYGNFLQTIFDFIIITFAIFLVIKAINRINLKKEKAVIETPKEDPADIKILKEIRDLLKEQKSQN